MRDHPSEEMVDECSALALAESLISLDGWGDEAPQLAGRARPLYFEKLACAELCGVPARECWADTLPRPCEYSMLARRRRSVRVHATRVCSLHTWAHDYVFFFDATTSEGPRLAVIVTRCGDELRVSEADRLAYGSPSTSCYRAASIEARGRFVSLLPEIKLREEDGGVVNGVVETEDSMDPWRRRHYGDAGGHE